MSACVSWLHVSRMLPGAGPMSAGDRDLCCNGAVRYVHSFLSNCTCVA